ncbi:hypothetical protein LTR53_019286, partial [Teratosphaeriaceae sp. CCFEE 6253]
MSTMRLEAKALNSEIQVTHQAAIANLEALAAGLPASENETMRLLITSQITTASAKAKLHAVEVQHAEDEYGWQQKAAKYQRHAFKHGQIIRGLTQQVAHLKAAIADGAAAETIAQQSDKIETLELWLRRKEGLIQEHRGVLSLQR